MLSPILASTSAKLIATPISLPFELIATQRQAGMTKQPFEIKFTGLGNVLLREVIFSGVFWPTNEKVFKYLTNTFSGDGQGMRISKETCTSLSAFLSGLAAGAVSYPFDALRTWRMVQTDSQQKAGWPTLWRNLSSPFFLSGSKFLI